MSTRALASATAPNSAATWTTADTVMNLVWPTGSMPTTPTDLVRFAATNADECRRARQRSATCTTARSHYTAATNGLGNRNCAALMMLDEHAEACALYSGTLRLTFDMSGGFKAAKPLWRRPLDGRVSEVIGPLPQIAPKKLCGAALWQGGMRRRGRPM